MNLKEEILKEHSKSQALKIVSWVSDNQAKFDELFELFVGEEKLLAQRSGWPLSYCVIHYPVLIKKHFGRLVANLQKPRLHNAVKRNTMRLLQEVPIPKKYQGAIMNTCFEYITSFEEPAAVKAISLTVLQNLSKEYPEIVPEIKLLIEERWDHETPAFKSRARKFLK